MTSQVYGLSSVPTDRNVADTRNYSRHYRQRLRAEVLLDAVCDITGVPETFQGMPPGTRADGLWTVRSESLFLDTFGRPDPNQDPPCERTAGLLGRPGASPDERPGPARQDHQRRRPARPPGGLRATTPGRSSRNCICGRISRFPADDETKLVAEVLNEAKDSRGRRAAIEDLLWALINTPEFLFKD